MFRYCTVLYSTRSTGLRSEAMLHLLRRAVGEISTRLKNPGKLQRLFDYLHSKCSCVCVVLFALKLRGDSHLLLYLSICCIYCIFIYIYIYINYIYYCISAVDP